MTLASSPDLQLASSAAHSWHGQLDLKFARGEQRTIVERAFAQAPLKFQRPFFPEAEVCHGVMLHTAGGIVGGDRLTSTIHLQPETHVLLTTAAATKIYRSNGFAARSDVQLILEENACLEWLPQETIVFDAAQYHQNLRVDLAPGAVWLGWEITRLGRSARGEEFSSGVWRSHIQVWQQDQLLWVDPQGVRGGDAMMQSPHGLAHCPVVGSCVLVGRSVAPEIVEQVRAAMRIDSPSPLSLPDQLPCPDNADPYPQTGTTRLINGLLCRYRGHSTLEARRCFTQVWEVLRSSVLGRAACRPRVW